LALLVVVPVLLVRLLLDELEAPDDGCVVLLAEALGAWPFFEISWSFAVAATSLIHDESERVLRPLASTDDDVGLAVAPLVVDELGEVLLPLVEDDELGEVVLLDELGLL
jgi:hypothetical protein